MDAGIGTRAEEGVPRSAPVWVPLSEAGTVSFDKAPAPSAEERARSEREKVLRAARARLPELEKIRAEAARIRTGAPMQASPSTATAALKHTASDAPAPGAETPPAADSTPDAERLSELEALVRSLEAGRRTDIATLQRAQESLANTQIELLRTTKELRAASERIRQLEADVGDPPAEVPLPETRRVAYREPASTEPSAPAMAPPPTPAPEPPLVEETDPMEGLAARISRLRGEISAHVEGVTSSASNGDGDGRFLSMRERLERAAAARQAAP
jgi:hypothetical protein